MNEFLLNLAGKKIRGGKEAIKAREGRQSEFISYSHFLSVREWSG